MDIDIDFADRSQILELIECRHAILENSKKHNTGVYVTEIPHNPVNNFATIDYKQAEDRGYFKLDFLNVSIYQDVESQEHLDKLVEQEPLWEILEYKNFVDNLFHLKGYHKLLQKMQPKNLEQLAAVLAMVRPAKKYLIGKSWEKVFDEIWVPPDNGDYYFKKSHAFSYSMAVVVHMNLLTEKIERNELRI